MNNFFARRTSCTISAFACMIQNSSRVSCSALRVWVRIWIENVFSTPSYTSLRLRPTSYVVVVRLITYRKLPGGPHGTCKKSIHVEVHGASIINVPFVKLLFSKWISNSDIVWNVELKRMLFKWIGFSIGHTVKIHSVNVRADYGKPGERNSQISQQPKLDFQSIFGPWQLQYFVHV